MKPNEPLISTAFETLSAMRGTTSVIHRTVAMVDWQHVVFNRIKENECMSILINS